MARGRYNRRHTHGVLRKKFAMRQLKARTARKSGTPRPTRPLAAQIRRARKPSTGVTPRGYGRPSGAVRTSTTPTRGPTSSASISGGRGPSTRAPRMPKRPAAAVRTSTTQTRGRTSSASIKPRRRKR